jgi:hypothetical protein
MSPCSQVMPRAPYHRAMRFPMPNDMLAFMKTDASGTPDSVGPGTYNVRFQQRASPEPRMVGRAFEHKSVSEDVGPGKYKIPAQVPDTTPAGRLARSASFSGALVCLASPRGGQCTPHVQLETPSCLPLALLRELALISHRMLRRWCTHRCALPSHPQGQRREQGILRKRQGPLADRCI